MTDKEKEATIHKVYHDPAGYGSVNNTLRDAQAIDKTIKQTSCQRVFEKQCPAEGGIQRSKLICCAGAIL